MGSHGHRWIAAEQRRDFLGGHADLHAAKDFGLEVARQGPDEAGAGHGQHDQAEHQGETSHVPHAGIVARRKAVVNGNVAIGFQVHKKNSLQAGDSR
jgi:hypothetical protein